MIEDDDLGDIDDLNLEESYKMTQKNLTVEEIAQKIWNHGYSDGRGDDDTIRKDIRTFLSVDDGVEEILSFATQETQEATEPLVEALELFTYPKDYVISDLMRDAAIKALTAHRAKYPRRER